MEIEHFSGSSMARPIHKTSIGDSRATTIAQSTHFTKQQIAARARDNISPRARLEYYPGYYAADVFDPDGYSFEVVHKS